MQTRGGENVQTPHRQLIPSRESNPGPWRCEAAVLTHCGTHPSPPERGLTVSPPPPLSLSLCVCATPPSLPPHPSLFLLCRPALFLPCCKYLTNLSPPWKTAIKSVSATLPGSRLPGRSNEEIFLESHTLSRNSQSMHLTPSAKSNTDFYTRVCHNFSKNLTN